MSIEYISTVERFQKLPRSKRLRELGGGTGSRGGAVVNITSTNHSGNTHTHSNLSTLEKISVNDEDYVYLEQLRESEDGKTWIPTQEKIKAGYADESAHANKADVATEADNADKWDGKHFADCLDQPVRTNDGVEFAEVKTNSVRSAADFVDGLTGEGFKLWRDEDGITYLAIDKLTVRQTMSVLELLIEKVRSVGGQLCVSAANGKIKEVEDIGDSYRIAFEQECTFVGCDLMRCQTFTGIALKNYWVEIADADAGGVTVAKTEFNDCMPEAGDECVLMGNTTNRNRQNLILISATEDGQPRIDVMDGVKCKNFTDCLRARLGNLDGINDSWFPQDNQPHGNGLYSDNAYLRGTFLLVTGEDIKTKFEITEGKIESSATALRDDFMSDKGYLNNATFADGLSKWDTEDETVFFLVGNRWVWANNTILSNKGNRASVTKDDGRTVVRIYNKYIEQKNDNLRVIPTFNTNSEGKKEALPVYLSFFYRCAKAGTLKVRFENVDKTGFANFNSMDVEEELEVTSGYKQYTCDGLWNGTGDFKLEFDGDIYLYMLVLSTDKVEALTHRYRTLLEQSERLVKISAAVFDKDENSLQETGLVVKPEGAGIYAMNAEGSWAQIGVMTDGEGGSKAVIMADNIQLEGVVTANGNFKILEDGSIETKNAKLNGYVYSVFKQIKLSDAICLGWNNNTGNEEYKLNTNLCVDATCTGVVLPVSETYEGARVLVMNSMFVKTRVAMPPTTIRTEDDSPIVSGLFAKNTSTETGSSIYYEASVVEIDVGTVELILMNIAQRDADTGNITSRKLQWVLINNSCQYLGWRTGDTYYEYKYNVGVESN